MIETGSNTWRLIERHLTGQLQLLRERNDQPLSESETADLRGEIRAVKKLLALPQSLARVDDIDA